MKLVFTRLAICIMCVYLMSSCTSTREDYGKYESDLYSEESFDLPINIDHIRDSRRKIYLDLNEKISGNSGEMRFIETGQIKTDSQTKEKIKSDIIQKIRNARRFELCENKEETSIIITIKPTIDIRRMGLNYHIKVELSMTMKDEKPSRKVDYGEILRSEKDLSGKYPQSKRGVGPSVFVFDEDMKNVRKLCDEACDDLINLMNQKYPISCYLENIYCKNNKEILMTFDKGTNWGYEAADKFMIFTKNPETNVHVGIAKAFPKNMLKDSVELRITVWNLKDEYVRERVKPILEQKGMAGLPDLQLTKWAIKAVQIPR